MTPTTTPRGVAKDETPAKVEEPLPNAPTRRLSFGKPEPPKKSKKKSLAAETSPSPQREESQAPAASASPMHGEEIQVVSNPVSTLSIYGELAEKDDVDALYNIGWMYLHGVGDVAVNRDKAYAYLYRASELGHASAPYHMALMQLGVGATDSKKLYGGMEYAIKNLELAESRGFHLACFELGVIYSSVKNTFSSLPPSKPKPEKKKAAASKPAPKPASPTKGKTNHVDPAADAKKPFVLTRDDQVARQWFEKAAAAGVAEAQARLDAPPTKAADASTAATGAATAEVAKEI